MITGIRYQAKPTPEQAKILSQWMGCAKVIWNAKCEDDRYLRRFAAWCMPVGTYPPVDQSAARYKDPELTPWLSECPSQILRNSATIWAETYCKFLKGVCGRPKRKRFDGSGYVWLTRELFRLKQDQGHWRLFIGTKTRDLGELNVKWHRKPLSHQLPNSIWVRKQAGRWMVSFSYEDGHVEPKDNTPADHLEWLRHCSEEELASMVVGLDRGVARPVQTESESYAPSATALRKQKGREKYLRRCQRKLARQQKGSGHRRQTVRRIASIHHQTQNVRNDFLHKTSRKIVDSAKVIVMEDLKLSNMTRRPKPKSCPDTGQWLKNNASAKSGLNRALLGVGLHRLETYITYKARRDGKAVFKINPQNTSRECAACGHIHADNRRSQSSFVCQRCGHSDNADRNAARVIKKRAIQLILHSGTELSGAHNNVFTPIGADVKPCKTRRAKARRAAVGLSKKKAA